MVSGTFEQRVSGLLFFFVFSGDAIGSALMHQLSLLLIKGLINICIASLLPLLLPSLSRLSRGLITSGFRENERLIVLPIDGIAFWLTRIDFSLLAAKTSLHASIPCKRCLFYGTAFCDCTASAIYIPPTGWVIGSSLSRPAVNTLQPQKKKVPQYRKNSGASFQGGCSATADASASFLVYCRLVAGTVDVDGVSIRSSDGNAT